jgi:S-adenosylmethionine synthetase
MATRSHLFTSESITEGHPDKVCDAISDAILDAHLTKDPGAHVACETLVKGDQVVLAGEITSRAKGSIDHEAIVRKTIHEIGYNDGIFTPDTVTVHQFLTEQAGEIDQGVSQADQGAGDQGLMFGFATAETTSLMPLPINLAHQLTKGLADDRHQGRYDWLRPDGKSQVTVRYEDDEAVQVTDVVLSTQHAPDVTRDEIIAYVKGDLVPRVLGDWHHEGITLHVNPTGSFVQGGPDADAGLTGRKIIADTYGGFARHGGGAFSGKDPSKVDRSAAYFCRYVARRIVEAGIARRAEIQVAYAIGEAQPVSVLVDTFGTGDEKAAAEFARGFDFRPAAIIKELGLLRPIYRQTTNYGHFGRPGLPWEGAAAEAAAKSASQA